MKDLLIKLGACKEFQVWASDKTWLEVYNTCERGDWLLWLFDRTNPQDIHLITLVKGSIASTVIHLMKDKRSIMATYAAVEFGKGLSPRSKLIIAHNRAISAAHDVMGTDTAANAAANAAVIATNSYDAYDSNAYVTADYASNAIFSEAFNSVKGIYTYAYAVLYASISKKDHQKLTANICRRDLSIDKWNIK